MPRDSRAARNVRTMMRKDGTSLAIKKAHTPNSKCVPTVSGRGQRRLLLNRAIKHVGRSLREAHSGGRPAQGRAGAAIRPVLEIGGALDFVSFARCASELETESSAG